MSREPRPDGRIVEVANFGSRFEADVALALLAENGIQAHPKYGDAGGWLPHVAILDGFRVFVFDEDLDAAREVLRTEELITAEAEPGPDPD